MMQIDEIALDKLRSLNRPNEKDFAIEMLEFFLTKTQENRQWMTDAFQTKNFSAIKNQAHSLKSVAAALGLTEVTRLATLLDSLIKDSNYSECDIVLKKLMTEYNAACAAVVSYIATAEM